MFYRLFFASIIASILPVLTLEAKENSRITYIKQELRQKGFSEPRLATLFADPRLQTIQFDPKDLKPWTVFRREVLSEDSLNRGKNFLKSHQTVLQNSEKKFGVPKNVLVAVLRVETDFGGFLGRYPVINALYTNLITRPKWKSWAENMVAFLSYCENLRVADRFSIFGSYTGAFGYPQFMPVSISLWGIDGDGDGKINLFDVADAIPSAANFLKKNGWQETLENQLKALTRYYGQCCIYPQLVLDYVGKLEERTKNSSSK